MKIAGNVIRSLTMVFLFASIGALLTPAMNNAFADDMSPSLTENPGTPVVGGTMMIVVNAGDANDLPHVKGIVRVYEPGTTPGFGGGVYSSACGFGTTTGTGNVWEFRQASNTALPNEYTMTVSTDSLSIPFGVNGASVTPTKTPGVSLSQNQGVWVEVNGNGGGDVIDILTPQAGLGPYRASTCGYDNEGQGTDEDQYQVTDPFGTQPLVGGMILGVNTTALLVAGLGSSPLLILPALGMIAGGAFALLKFQMQRKD